MQRSMRSGVWVEFTPRVYNLLFDFVLLAGIFGIPDTRPNLRPPILSSLPGSGATPARRRFVILISGRGSNMQSIVRACAAEGWPADVVAVIANKPQAAG